MSSFLGDSSSQNNRRISDLAKEGGGEESSESEIEDNKKEAINPFVNREPSSSVKNESPGKHLKYIFNRTSR